MKLYSLQVEDLVMVLDEQLRAKASQIAQRLRKAGRRVDLVLEAKKMKWVFKVCSPLPNKCCGTPSGTASSSFTLSKDAWPTQNILQT